MDLPDYRRHAESLSADALNLIKAVLIKHEAAILEEIHALVNENSRLRGVLTDIADHHEHERIAADESRYHEDRRNFALFHRDYVVVDPQ